MKPIGKYIVIQTIEEQLKTKSGILLTATDAEEFRYKKGKVIKPGTNVNEISEEDIIYFDKSAGFSLLLNDISYTVPL